MNRIFRMLAAVCVCGALASSAAAVTTGQWNFESGAASARQAAQSTIQAESEQPRPDWSRWLRMVLEYLR